MFKYEQEIIRLLASIISPTMLLLGLIGNIFTCIVYSRKKFSNFPIRHTFVILGLVDIFYLSVNLTIDYFNYAFDWDLRDQNEPLCLVINYFGYLVAPLSPWLLVYISVERLVSISPSFYGLNKLKKVKFQTIYFIFLVIFNLVYYIPVLFFINMTSRGSSNETFNHSKKYCDFIDLKDKSKFAIMDLAYSTLVPGMLMLLSTVLIINCIHKSSYRLFKDDTYRSRKRLRKDFKFAITSIFLNIVFVILNLPICIIYLDTVSFNLKSLKYLFSLYLFYATYAVNFYLFLLSNSSFRHEFIRLIGIKRFQRFNSEGSFDASRRETYKITQKNNS